MPVRSSRVLGRASISVSDKPCTREWRRCLDRDLMSRRRRDWGSSLLVLLPSLNVVPRSRRCCWRTALATIGLSAGSGAEYPRGRRRSCVTLLEVGRAVSQRLTARRGGGAPTMDCWTSTGFVAMSVQMVQTMDHSHHSCACKKAAVTNGKPGFSSLDGWRAGMFIADAQSTCSSSGAKTVKK